MCEPRSWRQWCSVCNKEFLAGFYIHKDAKDQITIRQWHVCDDCGSNKPGLRSYEDLASTLVEKALL